MNATSTIDTTGTGHCLFKHPTCDAELHLNGAHIAHWQPKGQRPVIFMSPRAIFAPGTPIRGGVPICLPWFGPHPTDPKAPAHGIVRTKMWNLIESTFDDSGWKIHLRHEQTEPAGDYWKQPFIADFLIGFGKTLSMELTTTNKSDVPFVFAEALHAYYAVSDVQRISVQGLRGKDYIDKTAAGAHKRETDPAIRFEREIDRVYLDTADACTIIDGGWKRKITVSKTGSQSTVVWNPFENRASQLPDLGSGNWPGFVCVESANCLENSLTLQPGAAHTIGVRVEVDALEEIA